MRWRFVADVACMLLGAGCVGVGLHNVLVGLGSFGLAAGSVLWLADTRGMRAR